MMARVRPTAAVAAQRPIPPLATALLLAVLVGAGGSRVMALDARLLQESADGARLHLEIVVPPPIRMEEVVDGVPVSRFHLEGYRPEASPGAPQLWVGTSLVAVPPGGRARLRVLESDIADYGNVVVAPQPVLHVRYTEPGAEVDPSNAMPLEVVSFEPTAYAADGARTEPARLGDPGQLRHVDVVPLEIRPLLYDPATRHLRVVRRLVVEVSLTPGTQGGADALSAAQALAATGSQWQRVYGHLLVNAVSAGTWLHAAPRQEAAAKPLPSGLLPPGMLQEDEWKLRVNATGPVRVTAASLVAQGFPSGVPNDRVRLVAKFFDSANPLVPDIVEIPLHVVDQNQNGTFESGDAFLFYAEMPRDDARRGERAQRYSFDNVYWLSVLESGSTPPMPVRPPVAGALPGPTTFPQALAYEEDREINRWVFSDDADLYYTNPLIAARFDSRYSVSVPGRNSASDVRVTIEARQDWIRRPFTAFAEMPSGARVTLGTHAGHVPSTVVGPPPSIVTGVVPAATMESATLTAGMTAVPLSDDYADVTPFLDLVRVEYTADYVATGDRIRFTSGGATGAVEFSITGFSGAALRAFDITDPKQPATFDLTGALSGGTLRLTDQIPAAASRVYLALADAAIPTLSADRIEPDTNLSGDLLLDLSTLPVGSYDVLVVAHDQFLGADLDRWVAFRESQGTRVRVARTSDIYDAFNGGLLHYDPIYNLTRAAYTNWGISHIMLVGDGSEDAAHLLATSGPNYVPARVRYFAVRGSSETGPLFEHRNDMNDRHYAKMGPDIYPDLLIGRLPVSNAPDLRSVVDKILLYEQPLPDDDGRWRKRVVAMSDDEWLKRSVSGIPGVAHRRGCSEWEFFRSIRRTCATVDGAFPGDLKCVPYYMHTISDSLSRRGVPQHAPWDIDAKPNPPCSNAEYQAAHTSGGVEVGFYQGEAAKALADSIGAGCLFFALQSHAAWNVVTDEQLIRTSNPFTPELKNHGKPFVFFGFGCHLNEFGRPGEDGNQFGTGDALGEVYVTAPERAAVASYASCGFELLPGNVTFHELMWRVFFEKRYTRDVGGRSVNPDTIASRWQLSELLQISEASYGDGNVIDRYNLLGDPLLRLDAGVPRFQVEQITNGFLREGNRIGALDPALPVEFTMRVNDEQGIDSLWVEKRRLSGPPEPITGVTITANLDTLPQVRASRSYTLAFAVMFDACDFDLVVGARDLGGRTSEFVGRGLFEQQLLANGLELETSGEQHVDPRTAFRYRLLGCAPLQSPLPLVVRIDGTEVPTEMVPDSLSVNWDVDFVVDLGVGAHQLVIEFEGRTILDLPLSVGGFSMTDVIAFPNPFADVTRFYFHLEAPVARGTLRIMDLNGRTVRQFDLAGDGQIARQTESGDIEVLDFATAGSIGTSMGWNFLEWNGTDRAGDDVANGVYLYELRLEDAGGRALRKRDKVVVMR
jgi:hypothetical protein